MNKTRLLERFLRYVACDSESGNERRFCELLEAELKALGLTVIRDEAAGRACESNGFNLYARQEGKTQEEGTLFCAHVDTVSPGVGIRPVIEDGVIRSSGDTILGSDDKSGIAAILEALESLLEAGEKPAHPVELLFTLCEEVGLKGASAADMSPIQSKQAIVLDTGGDIGTINRRSPSMMNLHVEFYGKAAHAGAAFDEGVHALKAAAKVVAELPLGYVDENSVRNISNFLSPGKTNVVADKATFDMEIRCFSEDGLKTHIAEVEAKLCEADVQFGTTHTVTYEPHGKYFDVPEDHPFLQKVIGEFASMGIEAKPQSTYGGSDTSVLSERGLSAVNISTGMRDAHSVTEHIYIRDLECICAFLEQYIR